MQNIDLLLAREQVSLVSAQRRLAAAQWLPNLNVGASLNHHLGPLQAANGAIVDVNRDSAMAGLGVGAVGGGTVPIPGIQWNGNLSATIYRNLVAMQVVQQARHRVVAVENELFLRVASAYVDLLKATGRRAIAVRILEEAKEVARITANFAKVGQGRQADADRASSEYELRKGDVVLAEQDMGTASARLAFLVRLDATVRLVPVEASVFPESLFPEETSLAELIALALLQRAELQERRAVIQAALHELQNAKCLPFSPTVILNFSAATFGGGSDLARDAGRSRFGEFSGREDFDAVMFWSLRNLGVGNAAQIRFAQSQVRMSMLQELGTLDRIKAEVSIAQVRIRARAEQILIAERAVESSAKAFQEDIIRTKNREGLPIEVINSLRLLGRGRTAYLDAILEHNRAQFELYAAVGMPNPRILTKSLPASLQATGLDAKDLPSPKKDTPKTEPKK